MVVSPASAKAVLGPAWGSQDLSKMKWRFLLQCPERGRQWTSPSSPSMGDHYVLAVWQDTLGQASSSLPWEAGEGVKLVYVVTEGQK